MLRSKVGTNFGQTRRSARTGIWWLAVFVLLLAFALMASSALQKSATVDEQSHLFRGVAYLREGATHFLLGHPLGASALSAMPVLTEPDLALPLDTPAWEAGNWSVAGDLFMWRLGNSPQRLLFLGRLPVIWLSLLLLALVFRWGRELAGRWAGLLATGLLAFDPNLLAHDRIISGDVAMTLFFVLTLYGTWRWSVKDGGWKALLLAGAGLGLASVSKFNAGLLLPILGLLGLFWAWRRRSWRPLLVLLLVGAVGGVIIWAVNGFGIRPLPGGAFWDDLFWVLSYFGQPHGAYLAGEVSTSGWWYYFPVVFLLKTPLPTLLLLLAAVGVLLANWWWTRRKSGTQRRTEKNGDLLFLLLPTMVYLSVSLTSSLNIGYRHLLPILPFLWLFTAVSLQNVAPSWVKNARFVGGGVIVWLAIQAVFIWPDYIPFFNLLAGGDDQSWQLLSDSNIDWGQDLPALAAWQQETGRAVNLSYFGTAHASAYGIDFVPMPMWPPAPEAAPPGRQLYDPQNPAPGVYALSVTSLHGVVLGEQRDAFAWFREQEPLARLGGSIFLYEVVPTAAPVDLVLFGMEPAQLSSDSRAELESNDLRVRWLNDGNALLWPAGGGFLALVEENEIAGTLRPYLQIEPVVADNQQLYRLPAPAETFESDVRPFADILELRETIFVTTDIAEANAVRLMTWWRVLGETERSLKLFVHAVAADGEIIGQWDGLTVDATSWQPGDQFVQLHQLNWATGSIPDHFLVGVYDGETQERLGEPIQLPFP
ncbi:phospholipid carrier-dependent glycosyltransferase [Candidatus Leptofilum sp.]|uniref:phospholipid carrier-dependent glycosyltransferase n=1 Tax=Candidatus Leptofilum sp. TaxID=3241576 RepID=UPI003B5AE0C7